MIIFKIQPTGRETTVCMIHNSSADYLLLIIIPYFHIYIPAVI